MSSYTLLILSIFAFALSTALVLYILFLVVKNFQPSSNKVKEDIKVMKKEIEPWIDQLVPWGTEEIALLSQTQVNKSLKKGIVTTVKGIFNSIYQEPMLAYTYKKYVAPKRNAILYVRSSHREFMYRFKGDRIQLKIDNQLVGTIDRTGKLYRAKDNQLMARIDREKDILVLPIIIGNKEGGSMLRPGKSNNANARAFEEVVDLGKDEEAIFLSLAILELVRNELP